MYVHAEDTAGVQRLYYGLSARVALAFVLFSVGICWLNLSWYGHAVIPYVFLAVSVAAMVWAMLYYRKIADDVDMARSAERSISEIPPWLAHLFVAIIWIGFLVGLGIAANSAAESTMPEDAMFGLLFYTVFGGTLACGLSALARMLGGLNSIFDDD